METDASQARQLAKEHIQVCSSLDEGSWDGFLEREALGTLEKAYADMGEAWLRRAIEARTRGGEAGLEAILEGRIEGPLLETLYHVNYLAVLEISGTLQELRQLLEGVVHHSPRRAETAKQIFRMLKTKEPDLDGKITLKVAIPGEGTQGRKSHYLDVYPVNDAFDDLQWYQQLHAMAFYMKGLNLRISSNFYVLRGSAEEDKPTQWKYEAVLGHYLRSLWGIFCSTGQAGYKRTHLLKYKVNAGPLDVQRDDPYNWADEKDDDDDEDLDERAFWGADEIEDVEGDSRAAQWEEQDLAFLDAAALAGLPIGREFIECLRELVGGRAGMISGVAPAHFIQVLTEALPLVATGKTVLVDEDALDLAAATIKERMTLPPVLEALLAVRVDRRGGAVTVDADVLDKARRLEELLVSAGLLDKDNLLLPADALLASWAEISMFNEKRSARDFYHAAREAGHVVSRAWAVGLHEAMSRVDGLKVGPTLVSLAHALPLAPPGALLRDASVLKRAIDAARIDIGGEGMILGPLLKGDRKGNPALDAALTKLEEKGFHTGPIAAYDDVLDPEMTQLLEDLQSSGITNAEAVVDALKTVDGLQPARTLRLILAVFRDAPGVVLAPGQRDALRRAARETGPETTRAPGTLHTSKTLKPLLELLNYADTDAAVLEKKATLVKALDEGNVHKQNVSVITYDVFIAKDAADYVTEFAAAAKAAGCSSVTVEKAEALVAEIGKDPSKEGLNGCQAKDLIKVLTALLQAGPCDGRTLEDKDRLTQACIAARLTRPAPALMHLLNALTGEDGPEPTKTKDKKRWNERRAAAQRIADLLHEMGIHTKNVTFASYAAVYVAWRAKEDKRKQKAEEAQFNADMDDIDNAEDEEPKAKRPKRSCSTGKSRRGGSA